MNKLSTNLIVAVLAFFIGLASASALNEFALDDQIHPINGVQSDAMGNVRANQE